MCFLIIILLVSNNYISFIEIKILVWTAKIQESILPDFQNCRFLHAGFSYTVGRDRFCSATFEQL